MRLLLLMLPLGGCSASPFSPFPRCETDCPLPETTPPNANWVFPGPNQPVRATDILHVSATDDIRVAYVEIFWDGFRIHAGAIAAPPYTAPWVGAPWISIGALQDGDPLTFTAVATDVEGNADTVEVTAFFEADP